MKEVWPITLPVPKLPPVELLEVPGPTPVEVEYEAPVELVDEEMDQAAEVADPVVPLVLDGPPRLDVNPGMEAVLRVVLRTGVRAGD